MSANNISKSAHISALVQALRAGQLTKEQLFNELHALQRGGESLTAAENNTADAGLSAVAARQERPAESSTAPTSYAAPQTTTFPSHASDVSGDYSSVGVVDVDVQDDAGTNAVSNASALHQVYTHYLAAATGSTHAAHSTQHTPSHTNTQSNSAKSTLQRGRSTANMVGGMLTAGVVYHPPSATPPPMPPMSTPGSGYRGPSHAAAAAERRRSTSAHAAHRADAADPYAEDCTFKPNIKPLPAQYGNATRRVLATIPFQDRAQAWARHKQEDLARLAAEAQEKELEGCTFRPQVNRGSKVLSEQRSSDMSYIGGDGGSEVHERLYRVVSRSKTPSRVSSTQDAAMSAQSRGRSQTSAMRVFGEGRPLFTSPSTGSPRASQSVLVRNGELESAPLTKAEEDELKECTFQPKVHTTYEARPVKSRYKAAARRASSGSLPVTPHLPTGMDQCTFKPKTNEVDVRNMPAAAMYVRAPIFERLAKTHTHAQREREEAARMGSSAGSGGSRSDDTGSDAGSVNAEERRRRHEEFLARQKAMEQKRQQKLEAIAAELAPLGQPALCQKSIEIAESSRQGSFLERVANETARKEHDSLKTKARLARDPECTFQPKINPASKNLRGRSIVELSRGDQLKKETAVRLMRLRTEAEELEGVTFAPAINAKSKSVSSRLRINEDPDSYVLRLKAEADHAAQKARQLAEEQERAALSECTFKPAIHDAPDYIKRIARSMALARAVRPPEPASVKPQWR